MYVKLLNLKFIILQQKIQLFYSILIFTSVFSTYTEKIYHEPRGMYVIGSIDVAKFKKYTSPFINNYINNNNLNRNNKL